ncbi:MAG: hypothetical protein ACJ8AO_02250 [Gemmatimonadaceae bacterium]
MEAEFLRWIASLGTALLAAFVATALTLRRTKSERRWQAKYEAYQRILGAVEDVRYWAESTYADTLMLPSLSQAKLTEASGRFEEAKRALSSFVHIGELVISADALELLDRIRGEISSEEFRYEDDRGGDDSPDHDLAEHCDKIRRIVEGYLPRLLSLARDDIDERLGTRFRNWRTHFGHRPPSSHSESTR